MKLNELVGGGDYFCFFSTPDYVGFNIEDPEDFIHDHDDMLDEDMTLQIFHFTGDIVKFGAGRLQTTGTSRKVYDYSDGETHRNEFEGAYKKTYDELFKDDDD